MEKDKRFALVVGNDDYPQPFRSLEKAVSDASDFAAFLKYRLGFQVTTLFNKSASEVEAELLNLAKKLRDDTLFLFFFAGHGQCVGNSRGQSLLCKDVNEFSLYGTNGSGVISPETLTIFSRNGRGDMIFLLDACRSQLLQQRSGPEVQRGGAGLRDMVSRPNGQNGAVRGRRLTLSSCADGEGAYDDGRFMKLLIDISRERVDGGYELEISQDLVASIGKGLNWRQTPELDGSPIVLYSGTRGRIVPSPSSSHPDVEREKELERLRQRVTELERLRTNVVPPQPQPISPWSESSSRKAGTRQTLKIGSQEYGFCWMPAGEFDMGSPEMEKERWDNETLHHVKLTRGFWMLESPTPQSLYKAIMGENPSNFKGDNLPVETVSWYDAMKFCAELTKRLPQGLKASLPTESQWEYACRAGTTTPYSFGNVLNGDKANCDGNYPYGTRKKGRYLGKTSPLKSYAPNGWGLYDVHGNVWEWCLDYYGEYPTGTVVDPKGPDSASDRVIRGGGWGIYAGDCRSAIRCRDSSCHRSSRLGFRFLLVCD